MKTSKLLNPRKGGKCLFGLNGILFNVSMVLLVWASAAEAGGILDALTQGQVSANFRYRYEWVNQGGFSKDANASTLRSRFGYRTRGYKGFSAFLEFEDISVIGPERYDNTANGKDNYPVVTDPEDTEINQVYLRYQGLEGTTLQVGRRRLIFDNARFIGNVGWRQNEQTFDSLSVENKSLPGTTITYAYLFNANRIFGEHHPSLSDIRMDTHLLNLSYKGFNPLAITAYAYLFDSNTVPDFSSKTFGLRLNGGNPIGSVKLLYTLEYANQSDYADGLSTNDADYVAGMLGMVYKAVTLKVNYESLAGDGTYGFSTPLATLHAFQGWTDKFLVTPSTGIRDLYFDVSTKVAGTKIAVVYHDFSSDSKRFDYGSEWDVLVVKKINKHYLLGIKYATYEADKNANNTGRTAVDVQKLWITGQMVF